MAKMDETELRAIIRAEKANALGGDTNDTTNDSELAGQRATEMNLYLGEMGDIMPTRPGRSRVVSTDVADTVESIMPILMDIFTGSDEIARFPATSEDDEEKAKEETDYVNYVFLQENNGFKVLYETFKDALIQKNGIGKFWWDDSEDTERETYRDLTSDAYALLEADPETEVIEHTEEAFPIDEGLLTRIQNNSETLADVAGVLQSGGEEVTLHDAVVMKNKPGGKVCVEALAPEHFLIAKGAVDIPTSRYCAHQYQAPRSDLIADGFDEEQVMDLPADNDTTGQQSQARDTVGETDTETTDTVNKLMEEISVTEHYLLVDWDGDGLAELNKVTTAGDSDVILERDGELDIEPYDRMPFFDLTPIIQPHRFFGRSITDIVAEIQKINTSLWRHLMDDIYHANTQRLVIAQDLSNDFTIPDALSNAPGAHIRADQPGAVTALPHTSVANQILPVIEYTNQRRETATGVFRHTAGQGGGNPFNETATGVNMLASAGQARVRLIARIFAEGVKTLMLGVHELILKNGTEAKEVKLGKQWVTVDPRTWKNRRDMTIMLPLGAGTRDQMASYLQQILALQTAALERQQSPFGPLVSIENVYNTAARWVENAGFNDAEPFFMKPDMDKLRQQAAKDAQRPPPPDPATLEVQRRAQRDQGELSLKEQKQQGDQAVNVLKLQQDATQDQAELQQDAQQNVASLREARFEAILKSQTDLQQARLDAMTDRIIAATKQDTEMQIAELRAQWEAFVATIQPVQPVQSGGQIG